MKTIRRVIGALLLITALLVTQIPVVETSAAPSSDFQIDKTTLVKYTGTASSVSIPSSVKTIGAEAFAGNTSLTAVSIGSSVTEIQYGAFRDCANLSTIDLKENIITIGNGAFSNNTALKKITLPKNLKNFGSGVFAGCTNLSTINIDKDNPYFTFDKNGLYDKEKTILYCFTEGSKATQYSMPNTVKDIDEYAFWGNDSLKEISLSTDLKEIPSYAFSNCRNLLAVAIPYSIKSIDSKAFENCISLQKVLIPASVSYIHDTAFDGCPKLVISADSGSTAHKFYENWKITHKTDVGTSEKEDGDTVVDSSGNVYIVGSGGSLTLVEKGENSDGKPTYSDDAAHDPSNVDYIPEFDPLLVAESDDVLGKTVVVGESAVFMMNSEVQVINGINNRDVFEEEEVEAGNKTDFDDSKDGSLPKYAIVNDRITDYAYYGDSELSTYSIPAVITSIGDFAFSRTNLAGINIPKGVTTIGYAAFYHCDNLKEISIPETVTWIEPSAFSHTAWLNTWASNIKAEDFLVVGDGILIAYKGSKQYVEIPDTVKTIAPACFLGHTEIQGIKIPDSVTIIGEEAFKDCTSLKEVHGGSYIKTIQDRAFENTDLIEIIIPEFVEQIGVGAFYCNNQRERKVIFNGNKLPHLMNTDTTSRISSDLLKPAFSGNWTAIINNSGLDLSNTIFNNTFLGFTGDIAVKDTYGNTNVFRTNNAAVPNSNAITIDSQVSDWNSKDISAWLNYSGEYHLKLSDESEAIVSEAFKRIYGNQLPAMKVFDMTLFEETDTVKITNFGTNPLTVMVPLPTEIEGNTVHVVALDEDGQLEKLASSIQNENGKDYIRFSTDHLSTFAIYALGENGTIQIKNGVASLTTPSSRKDYSPNTGDNSIHPKWFIAIGLTAMAIALIAYKPRKKR